YLPAQIAAALALLGPTYIWSWESDAVTRTLVLLAESVILLRFASARGLRELGALSIAALGLVVVRAAAAPLALEASTAAFGVITIALVLAAPRISWRRLPREYEMALEILAVALVVSSGMERTLTASANTGGGHAARVLAESVAVLAIGLASSRRALATAGLGAVTLGAVWVLG